MFKLKYFLDLFFILSFTCANAFAQKETLEQKFIENNKDISSWFDSAADGLDLFLVGKRITNNKNPSNFKIINTSSSTEGDNFSNTTSLNVNLRLQNLEQYFQLKFTSSEEKNSGRAIDSSYLRKNREKKNYAATLGLFKKMGSIRTSYQPKIELQDPLKVSNSVVFESMVDYSTFQVHPKLELYASAYTGAGIVTEINFNSEINEIFSLTFPNEFEYQDKLHKFLSSHGVSIGQVLSEKSALTYSVIYDSHNRNAYHLESYDFSASYSRIIYKKILDLQITPHLEFQKDKAFKGAAGLIFQIGLQF